MVSRASSRADSLAVASCGRSIVSVAEPDRALPPLREVIRRYELGARKALGQNFLLDLNLTRRIAREAAPLADAGIIEIGPGPGGLTRALLLEGARHVTAIERDRRCIAALEELAAAFPGRLAVVEGDALEIDPRDLVPEPRKIVANLPYNIATALLLRWLPTIGAYESLTLMFQKEVAQRLAAAPRSRDYGRLSVMVQWCCQVRALFDIPPQAFVPPPKVTSTLVQLLPRAAPLAPCRFRDLERVVAAAFGQRRKMLRQSLRSLGVDVEALLAATGIAATARAEELGVEQFCALARAFGG
jgi:16S rRNA (adenine1518-N6/adenine1519-N6)-dimethyltransferase